jgi:transketolase
VEPAFFIPEPALTHFRKALAQGRQAEADWDRRIIEYVQTFPDVASELQQRMRNELPQGWDADISMFPADTKGLWPPTSPRAR